MTTEEDLIKAIVYNPGEDTPRLMYADFLEELGESEKATLFRRLPHRSSPFESLLGKTVKEIWTDEDSLMYIVTDSGVIRYHAEGDCCSISWFYRILNANHLIGHKAIIVLEGRGDVDPDDGLCQQDVDSIYSYCIASEVGGCEITFRCSSNGYYGGWLEPRLFDTMPEAHLTTDVLRQVTESWQVDNPYKMECVSKEEDKKCKCVKCLIPGADRD